MKKSNKKGNSSVVLILYVISVLLGIYTIFTLYNSYTYISSLVSQGLVISDELASVISYVVGGSVPYMFYSIAIWAIGYTIKKLNYIASEVKISNKEIQEEIISVDNNNITEEIVFTDSDDDTQSEL
ncbi:MULTISPECIES: hypothetical protein [unclassified Romboutsia]|uniref:hypothetical protein n=1 Tax=unclassified Romboutsia TaxID=2626894 RepID=UPI000820CE3F|nr:MULTISPECIES: hypothetical protein [unclassified Romboutsia]SCH86620.1 Uncharacterised protein [uncultured Clostridium sp.]